MKAYSFDLRHKILHVYENEAISQRQLAKRFCVALSFIQKLLKQYRTTGSIAAKRFAGGVKLKVNAEQMVILAELISANNDATLEEFVRLFQEKTGISKSPCNYGENDQKIKHDIEKKTLHAAEKETERVQ